VTFEKGMFSIVVATYNSEATVARTLESIQQQVDAKFEVLILDGASRDRTLAVVNRYPEILGFVQSEPDRGVYDAWNKALPHIRGEWVMFLGSDDHFDGPDVLSRLSQFIQATLPADPALSYVFSITELHDGKRTIKRNGETALAHDRLDVGGNPPFSHTGLLHHVSLFHEFGGFDATYRFAGDYEFFTRTALDPRTRFHHVPIVVAQMASGGISDKPENRILVLNEVMRARQSLGLLPKPAWLKHAFAKNHILALLQKLFDQRTRKLGAMLYRAIRSPSRKAF
jgi:hypothetical protein